MLSYSVVTGRIEHLFGETRHIDFINKLAQDSTVASDLFVFFGGGGEGEETVKTEIELPPPVVRKKSRRVFYKEVYVVRTILQKCLFRLHPFFLHAKY